MGDTKFKQTHRRTRNESLRREIIQEIKRTEAIERNAAWAALSKGEKIASLCFRRGSCARQLKRLA